MARPHVVIVGAGFGGLACARRLAKKPVRVTVIDRNNYHLFTPLLYQVASSLLNPSDIAQPVRGVFRSAPNIRFHLGTVSGVDLEAKQVQLASGDPVPFDYLVLAAGSTTNYFGMESVEQRALGLKDLPEALELRNHILRCLEEAAQAPDEESRRRWLTFVIVGGGPTGVEYAGALSELVRLVIPEEYPELRRDEVRIALIEALPEILPAFPEQLGREGRVELTRRGVDVMTETRVLDVKGPDLHLSEDRTLSAETLIWAAGVKPERLAGAIDVPRTKSGRIEVDEHLRVKGREDVFAIGDLAAVMHNGREVPMLAGVAMQEARSAGDNVLAAALGKPLKPFTYRDRGSMATIGRNSGVASIGRFRLHGFLGWVAWLAVHLYYIIGFRNRISVLGGWAWNYLRFDRPVRIIARARSDG